MVCLVYLQSVWLSWQSFRQRGQSFSLSESSLARQHIRTRGVWWLTQRHPQWSPRKFESMHWMTESVVARFHVVTLIVVAVRTILPDVFTNLESLIKVQYIRSPFSLRSFWVFFNLNKKLVSIIERIDQNNWSLTACTEASTPTWTLGFKNFNL